MVRKPAEKLEDLVGRVVHKCWREDCQTIRMEFADGTEVVFQDDCPDVVAFVETKRQVVETKTVTERKKIT